MNVSGSDSARGVIRRWEAGLETRAKAHWEKEPGSHAPGSQTQGFIRNGCRNSLSEKNDLIEGKSCGK